MIDASQNVLDIDWGDVQPSANDENTFLDNHSWDDYGDWHLGLTAGANDKTKGGHGFVYGNLRRVHRSASIASVYRAGEWRHKQIELAAHDLLQHLDETSARTTPHNPVTDASRNEETRRDRGGVRGLPIRRLRRRCHRQRGSG